MYMSNSKVLIVYIFYFVLFVFVGVIMIDPTNKLFHMKEITFILLMFITIIFQRGKLYKDVFVSYFLLVLFAILSVLIGFVVFNEKIDSLPYFKSLLFGTVFYAISKLNINEILRLNYFVSLVLATFVSIMLLSFVGGLFDLTALIERMSETDTLFLSRRDFLGMDILMFYYRTMPFCFLALIYALRKKYYLSSIIFLAPIVYGGSRTPMLVALSIVLYLLYDRKSKLLKVFLGSIFIIGIFSAVVILKSATDSEGGDEIKGGVASYLFNHSSVLSHGVGVFYWNPERKEMTNNTEVTYFEMLYQYGWLLFPFVLYIFLRPFFILYRKNNDVDVRDFGIAYLLYLINAGTNPLLISSTGIYVFASALTVAAKVNEMSNKQNINLI